MNADKNTSPYFQAKGVAYKWRSLRNGRRIKHTKKVAGRWALLIHRRG